MFAYCGNNPVSRADFRGHAFVQIDYNFSDHLTLFCPVMGGGGGGDVSSSLAVLLSGLADFSPGEDAYWEKTTYYSHCKLHEKILPVEFSPPNFTQNEFTLVSASISLYSADLILGDFTASPLRLGTAEVYASLDNSGVQAGAMFTIWQPSVEFELGGLEVSVAVNIGSIGSVTKIGVDGVTLGRAGLLGFTISVC